MGFRVGRAACVALLAAGLGVVSALTLAALVSPAGHVDARPRPRVQAAAAAAPVVTLCEQLARGRESRLARTRGDGEAVLVIGDSWATGATLPPGRRAWPSYLPGNVRVDGVPGSGFSERALGCPGLSYAGRAASDLQLGRPGLVVVQGGLNETDVPEDEVRGDFERLAAALRGLEVVVIGPSLAPARAEEAARVDALLTDLSAEAGFAYVPTTDLLLSYGPDGLHLTEVGHRRLGRAVAARVAALR